LRWKHEKLLKKLRRQRVKEKREKSERGEEIERNVKEPPTKRLVEEHAEKMEELWLPDTLNVKDAVTRPTLGFLTKGTAVSLCTLPILKVSLPLVHLPCSTPQTPEQGRKLVFRAAMRES